MKRQFSIFLLLATALTACSEAPEPSAATEQTETKPAAPPSSEADASTAAQAPAPGKTVVSNDMYEFSFTIPTEAMAIPALRGQLQRAGQAVQDGLVGDTNKAKKEAETEGWPYRAYGLDIEWQRVADLENYLSLSAQIYSFSGGAHGNSGFDSLVWDKVAGERLAPLAMFTSAAAFGSAIEPAFCKELDRQRVKKRGGPLNPGGDSDFDRCIDPTEQTVILGSSNGQTFDRVGILIGPYAAGPYAEGSYEVTLPVTKAVLAAVKPEYRAAFSIKK